MKFMITINDHGNGLSSINVYGVRNCTPYQPAEYELLDRRPYIHPSEVFDAAISLACRLKTAGFTVDVTRSGGDDK